MISVAPSRPAPDALEQVASRVLAHFNEHRPPPESFPMLASKVIDTAERPDVDAAKLARLIECDPAICAAVLALVNSAAHRPVTPITGVQQAIARLGLRDVTNVAVGVACRSLFDMEVRVQNQLFSSWWERLFHSAMTEAFSCEQVARKHAPAATEGMFLMGLLHDVGKSLALRSLASLVVSGELEPVRDERLLGTLLEVNNAEIGAIALQRFDMPDPVVRVCRMHSDEPLPDDPAQCHVVRLVSRVNALRLGPVDTEQPVRVLRASAGALSLDAPGVVAVARELNERAVLARELFSCGEAWDEDAFFERVESCMNE